MLNFIRQRWFLFALIAVLAGGMFGWRLAQPLADHIPRNVVVAIVMFLMALPMETGSMWQAVRRPGPAWLAAVINLGLAPPLGWLAAHVLPAELGTGMMIATVVPCTLAAATVWTRRAGGNDAVAILVTMITNLGCFLVVPAWLRVFVGDEAVNGAALDYGELVRQLLLLVVAPIVVAQLLRQWRAAGTWADRRKSQLSMVAQLGILTFVFAGAVRCGVEMQKVTGNQVLNTGNIAILIAMVIVVHLLLLWIGLSAARALRMERPDAIAVGIAGSQKTIMAGLFLATKFGALAILPMVAYHAAQLLLDTLIADWLRQRGPATMEP
jgi:sodium/bile acid cotransporter 7